MTLRKSFNGFTLVELLITMAVLSVLLSMAVPNFQSTVSKSRLTTAANDFIHALNYARSQAIRAGRSVVLCPSRDGARCHQNIGWESGWIAYIDRDKSGNLSNGEKLREWPALPFNYTLRSTSQFSDSLRYNALGALVGNAGSFVFCHDDSIAGAKAISITRLRPRIATDSDGDRVPELVSGTGSTNIRRCTNL